MTLYESRDSTINGLFWQFISSATMVIAGGLFYIFIIHYYPTQIVGVFSLLSAIAYLFSTIFLLGLNQGVQHFISFHLGRGEDGIVKTLIVRFSIVGLILSVLAFFSLWFSLPGLDTIFFHTNIYIDYLKLTDIEVFSMVIYTILMYMLLGLQSFKLNGLLNLVNYLVGYGLIIPLILMNENPVRIIYGWIIGYYLTTVLAFFFVYNKAKRSAIVNSNDIQIKTVLAYSAPIFVSLLVGYGAIYVDRFIVTALLNLSELGIYNFSLLIVSALSILTLPFTTILLSRLSEFFGKGDKESFRLYSLKAVENLTAVYVPLALIIAALSPSILLFLAKKSYISGAMPITIILVTSALTVSASIFMVTLQAIRRTRVLIVSSSFGLLSNLTLSLLLIPRYGIVGASVGYGSLSVVLFITVYYFSKKYGTYVYEASKLLKIYSSGFVTFFLMIVVQERLGYSILKLFTYLITGIAVYLFLIRVMGTFREDDVDLFLRMIPEKYARMKRFFKSLFV